MAAPARSSYDSQLLKGVLELVLLALLQRGESYGYEIVTNLHVSGFEHVVDGTVYPALTRMERDGLLEATLRASSAGPARKYYRLAAKGTAALAERADAWHALSGSIAALLDPSTPSILRKAAS